MELTEYALDQLVDIVKGDNGIGVKRTGPKLVALFNTAGQRDRYDFDNGGLPKLNGKTNNTSRKIYTFDRLKRVNEAGKIENLIANVVKTNVESDRQSVADCVNEVIGAEGYRLEIVAGEPVMLGVEEKEVIEVKVTFEDIQKQILFHLDRAKLTVWVAVAWFTNKVLFDKLAELKSRGVNIQVLVVDDETNRNHGQPIELFEGRRLPKHGAYSSNIMHSKFCVIDSKTVINGSYNWTNSAEYHKETITVIESRQLAEEFQRQFVKLKTS